MRRRGFLNFTPTEPEFPNVFHYTSSQNNVNFFADAGSPSLGNWNVIVDAGVILGSTISGTAAAITGVFPELLKVTVLGRIQGMGGEGGRGAYFTGKSSWAGGGGGGGAGTIGGLGGDGAPNAVDGNPGTVTAGGTGGNSGSLAGSPGSRSVTNGLAGGTALSLSMSAYIDAGEIWGGGGGGAGDGDGGGKGGDGGGPGLAGQSATSSTGGAAGKAVLLNGNTITWISQTDIRGGVS